MAVLDPAEEPDWSIPEYLRFELHHEYNRECVFCGISNEEHTEQHGRGLNAHHIIPRRAQGDASLENLILVCKHCHKALDYTHSRAVEQLKEYLDRYIRECLEGDVTDMTDGRFNFSFADEVSDYWHSFSQRRSCPECGVQDVYRNNTIVARCPSCGNRFQPFDVRERVMNGHASQKHD